MQSLHSPEILDRTPQDTLIHFQCLFHQHREVMQCASTYFFHRNHLFEVCICIHFCCCQSQHNYSLRGTAKTTATNSKYKRIILTLPALRQGRANYPCSPEGRIVSAIIICALQRLRSFPRGRHLLFATLFFFARRPIGQCNLVLLIHHR